MKKVHYKVNEVRLELKQIPMTARAIKEGEEWTEDPRKATGERTRDRLCPNAVLSETPNKKQETIDKRHQTTKNKSIGGIGSWREGVLEGRTGDVHD